MGRHQLELSVYAVRTELSWDSCFSGARSFNKIPGGGLPFFMPPNLPVFLSCLNAYFALKNMFVSLCLTRWGQTDGVYTKHHAIILPLLAY